MPRSRTHRDGTSPHGTGNPDAEHVRQFLVGQIMASARPGEMDGIGNEERDSLVAIAAELIRHRTPGTHRMHVGVGEGGAGQRRMPIVLLTDNMPFLVDSVSNAIGGEGLDIQRLIHPIIHVGRDPEGNLLTLGEADTPRESLILLQVRRAPARKRASITARLDQVYRDQRAAVTDWQAMVALMHESARSLNDAPPPVAPHILAESVAFLDWLTADNFTFLGAGNNQIRLGLLRDAERWPLPVLLHDDPRHMDAVLICKSARRSTVHRGIALDHIVVRQYDSAGRMIDAMHFLGLFASAALRESPRDVPILRRKVSEVAHLLGLEPRSHDGRALAHVIETFPREELFRLSVDELLEMATRLLSLQDRPRPEIFVRHDPGSETAAIFAYIPRDDYNARLRQRLAAAIEADTGGMIATYDVELRAEPLARVHFVVEKPRTPPDRSQLAATLLQLTRGWEDELEPELVRRTGAMHAARLSLAWGHAFGPGYRDVYSPAEGAEDLIRIASLADPSQRHIALSRHPDDAANRIRLKLFQLHEVVAISDSVPILENFGFRVIEEFPWKVTNDQVGWIHDFRLELATPPADFDHFCTLMRPALVAVFTGQQENDRFNMLIPACGLTAEEANWVRAWFRYLRQIGISYGMETVVDAARHNPAATRALVALFRARFATHDQRGVDAVQADLLAALDAIAGIDDDRILRLLCALVQATLRTNAFVPGGPEALAFKFDCGRIPDLPKPVPWREIWVYSPRVEGTHLRGGPLARGGLRWSDRRDDFRTEVLGLVKAQMVKNSIIVPTGAKGGFYAKQLPDPATDRAAWLAEGQECYRIFIRALLSITDNLAADGATIVPPDVVRADTDTDAYLVVAADKGTATFSDTANELAEKAGFWLGDAFASGGSAGYDHKAMGITARGAWISVTRHFAELGIDVARDSFTVAAVGDMSGDVFGNAMRRSRSMLLRAAFDHRHIFLDPAPDPERSFAERERLFHLPRSSWADYDPALLSAGGGVFARTVKHIPLSAEVREMLGVTADALAPSALIAAILRMPVDLLFFGGIGTYVKASEQSHESANDRANDAHRVNGNEVRARVIGEGANLGVTQRGRIEYARTGGRINTDFIDNSAGVDTSDHEVNIKIALSAAERTGKLDRADRDRRLAAMTDAVGGLVLGNNVMQTLALSIAGAQAHRQLPTHVRLVAELEARGLLDRRLEDLPTERDIAERAREKVGLTRPELAILLSYVKNGLKDALARSPLTGDPLVEADLCAAFPPAMQADFGAEIHAHPLRREIIATRVASLLVDRGGLTLANEVTADLGCAPALVAAAFVAGRTLFDLPAMWRMIDSAPIDEVSRLRLHGEAQAVTYMLVRDLCRQGDHEAPTLLVDRLAPGIDRIFSRVHELLRPEVHAYVERVRDRLLAIGAPDELAGRLSILHIIPGAIGVVALAHELQLDEIATAEAYTYIGQELGTDWVRGVATAFDTTDNWERLLIATTLRTMELTRLNLLRRLVAPGGDPKAMIERWFAAHADRVRRTHETILHARRSGPPTLAMLAHLASVAQMTTLAQ